MKTIRISIRRSIDIYLFKNPAVNLQSSSCSIFDFDKVDSAFLIHFHSLTSWHSSDHISQASSMFLWSSHSIKHFLSSSLCLQHLKNNSFKNHLCLWFLNSFLNALKVRNNSLVQSSMRVYNGDIAT